MKSDAFRTPYSFEFHVGCCHSTQLQISTVFLSHFFEHAALYNSLFFKRIFIRRHIVLYCYNSSVTILIIFVIIISLKSDRGVILSCCCCCTSCRHPPSARAHFSPSSYAHENVRGRGCFVCANRTRSYSAYW